MRESNAEQAKSGSQEELSPVLGGDVEVLGDVEGQVGE